MHWRGELLHLHVAPLASAPMQPVSEARLISHAGIEGDRYAIRLGTYSLGTTLAKQAWKARGKVRSDYERSQRSA